ncbi:hypothetical protein NEOKW01_0764 [Nematocida sp. AWRm80]|nr:hypothetical protein NEOKW01_0764 [Nematocida sp. AWRm80]
MKSKYNRKTILVMSLLLLFSSVIGLIVSIWYFKCNRKSNRAKITRRSSECITKKLQDISDIFPRRALKQLNNGSNSCFANTTLQLFFCLQPLTNDLSRISQKKLANLLNNSSNKEYKDIIRLVSAYKELLERTGTAKELEKPRQVFLQCMQRLSNNKLHPSMECDVKDLMRSMSKWFTKFFIEILPAENISQWTSLECIKQSMPFNQVSVTVDNNGNIYQVKDLDESEIDTFSHTKNTTNHIHVPVVYSNESIIINVCVPLYPPKVTILDIKIFLSMWLSTDITNILCYNVDNIPETDISSSYSPRHTISKVPDTTEYNSKYTSLVFYLYPEGIPEEKSFIQLYLPVTAKKDPLEYYALMPLLLSENDLHRLVRTGTIKKIDREDYNKKRIVSDNIVSFGMNGDKSTPSVDSSEEIATYWADNYSEKEIAALLDFHLKSVHISKGVLGSFMCYLVKANSMNNNNEDIFDYFYTTPAYKESPIDNGRDYLTVAVEFSDEQPRNLIEQIYLLAKEDILINGTLMTPIFYVLYRYKDKSKSAANAITTSSPVSNANATSTSSGCHYYCAYRTKYNQWAILNDSHPIIYTKDFPVLNDQTGIRTVVFKKIRSIYQ